MTSRSELAMAYFEASAAIDHCAILSLLTDDVVWDIHGQRRLQGKEAFDSEIENEQFRGPPRLTLDRIIHSGDTVVVPHIGEVARPDGSSFRFAACDIFTFDNDLICRVESYVVPM